MLYPTEVEIISCDICHKEVPLSEAMVPEATDYVAHFFGRECYMEWRQQVEVAVVANVDRAI